MNLSAPTHPDGHARAGVVLSGVMALLVGGLSSLQSRANGELAHVLGVPILASVWSFATGAVLIAVLTTLPSTRRGLRRIAEALRAGRLRWWELAGGVCGATFVAVQTVAVPALGVAMFTVGIVGGQTANALLVDRLGLGPAGRTPVTPLRAIAALLTFAGVALAASSQAEGGASGGGLTVPLVLAVLAGAGVAVQSAFNGKVNQASGTPVASAGINFSTGLIALTALAAIQLSTGAAHLPGPASPPWWSLLGGVIGVAYVCVTVVLVARLGVLVMTLLVLTGQLLSAVALDVLSPTAGAHVDARLIAGVVVALVAAGTATVSARPTRT